MELCFPPLAREHNRCSAFIRATLLNSYTGVGACSSDDDDDDDGDGDCQAIAAGGEKCCDYNHSIVLPSFLDPRKFSIISTV